jgi:hypothetical protein
VRHSSSVWVFRVNILERQHVDQPCFSILGKAAAFNEGRRILVGPEQSVPDGKITIVEPMNVELVMNGVQFGSLNEAEKPGWYARPEDLPDFNQNIVGKILVTAEFR